ncbi:MAG: phage holin family protein [Pseudomonadota bacterium]|nr:phage holin family protein [Pseudomonadota bacterium]
MDATPPPPAPDDSVGDNSIGHLFSRLIDDAERFVRAELGLYRAQALARIGAAKVAVVLMLLAFLIAQSSIIAMLVGLVLVVRQHIHSAAWATVIVVGSAMVITGVMVVIAVAKLKRITRIKATHE